MTKIRQKEKSIELVAQEIINKPTITLEKIYDDFEFQTRHRIIYDVFDITYPPDRQKDDEFVLLEYIDVSEYELIVELASMYYTKLIDKRNKQVEAVFDYFDEKHSKTSNQSNHKTDNYGSSSEMISEYEDRNKRKKRQGDCFTRNSRIADMEVYFSNRLVNYNEFLFYLDGEINLIDEYGEDIYIYINKNYKKFFKYIVGISQSKDYKNFKKIFEPNFDGYKKFIYRYGNKKNALRNFIINNKVPIYISYDEIKKRLKPIANELKPNFISNKKINKKEKISIEPKIPSKEKEEKKDLDRAGKNKLDYLQSLF